MKMGMEFWTAHVAAARLQATSASDYAKQHGISLAALYYWQRKLKVVTTGACDESSGAGKFVALRVTQAVVEQRPASCRPGGMTSACVHRSLKTAPAQALI